MLHIILIILLVSSSYASEVPDFLGSVVNGDAAPCRIIRRWGTAYDVSRYTIQFLQKNQQRCFSVHKSPNIILLLLFCI